MCTHNHSTTGADFVPSTVPGNRYTAVSISYGPCLSSTYTLTRETENHGIRLSTSKAGIILQETVEKSKITDFVSSGCYHRIPQTRWLKQQKCISHHSGGWKFEIIVPAQWGSGEESLPVLQTATFSLWERVLVTLPVIIKVPVLLD